MWVLASLNRLKAIYQAGGAVVLTINIGSSIASKVTPLLSPHAVDTTQINKINKKALVETTRAFYL